MRKSKKGDRGSKPRWAQVEDILEDWVLEQRSSCRGVSTCQLRLKANVITSDLDVAGFRGGPSWIGRFLKRKSLALRARTTMCQRLTADSQEKMDAFRLFVMDAIHEHGAPETTSSIWTKCPSPSTLP